MLRSLAAHSFIIAVPITLAAPLNASEVSEVCPPRTSTYDKCPNGFRQSWHVPTLPSYVDTDSDAEQLSDGRWEYHWCLKNTEQEKPEIYFIWPDLKVYGQYTGCGGFWGGQLQTPSPPSDVVSVASIGASLKDIQPQIKLPTDIGSPWYLGIVNDVIEYVSSIFASLSLGKNSDRIVEVEVTIKSTATPILGEDEQRETLYRIEISDSLGSDKPFANFYFSEDLTRQTKQLDGQFSFLDEPLEFTAAGPTVNMIGAVTFVDADGYEVGSMPVSLAVPGDK